MFSNLLRRGKATRPSYKPSVGILEDRIVPSGFWFSPPPPGPATHLVVETPYSVKADQPFYVEVAALSANNRLASGYTGTVAISLGTTDPNPTLPQNYTFTPQDHGIHWFQLTLSATGSQTIVATDTTTATITGSAATTVKAAPTATSFIIEAPQYAVEGGPVQATVIVLDQYHHVVPGYNGTIQITDSGGATGLPTTLTFTSSNKGEQTFQVTFNTTGSDALTATDQSNSSITGQATVNVEAANAVTHFGVFNYGSAMVGNPTSVVVIALDANNHIMAGYTGTVSLTSSDSSVVLPNYTFVAADDGRHTFSVTFGLAGSQTLTATDTVTSSITGTDNVWVSAQWFNFPWNWGFYW